jgi:sarcosine oxidase subunit beta
MSRREYDAIVIGGGLHGLSAALHLARRDARVLLLERHHVGRHSSGVNAGGVRRLGRDEREIALSQVAFEMWQRLPELVGDDCGFVPSAQVKVAENEAELAKLAAREARVRALGWRHEVLLDRDALFRLLPALSRHCRGALACFGDGAADPMRTVMAFRRACEGGGVAILEGVAVQAIEPGAAIRVVTGAGTFAAPRVANCAGAWARELARGLGEDIPCGVKASMMVVTERLPRFCEPTVGAAGRSLSFKQTPSGTVLIGGGLQGKADPVAERSVVNFGTLAQGARTAAELFPIVKDARIVRTWCGIEARTPDEIPVIGESTLLPGLFHSFGYSGHGFQLTPAAGLAMAELMLRGQTNLPVAPFTPARFALPAAA